MKRKVGDLLKEKGHAVYSIEDTKRLKDAVKLFNAKRVGALIVLNEEEEIQGIITERDILMRLAQTEGEIKNINVKNVMTSKDKLIVGTPEDSIDYIMKVMTTNRIRHIPIVGGESQARLEGLISIGDVVKALLSDVGYENKLLKDYIEGAYPV
jgi:CBS domain-containing protein